MKLDPELVRGILTAQNRENKGKPSVSELLHGVPSSLERKAASQTVAEYLMGLPLFQGLTNKEVSMLASLMHERTFGDGEIIFEQGTPSGALYLIREGCVELFHTMNGKEKIAATLGPNEHLGEIALLLDETPRQISARSKGPSEVLAFSRPDFDNLVARSPVLSIKVLRALGRLFALRFSMLIDALEGGSVE